MTKDFPPGSWRKGLRSAVVGFVFAFAMLAHFQPLRLARHPELVMKQSLGFAAIALIVQLMICAAERPGESRSWSIQPRSRK